MVKFLWNRSSDRNLSLQRHEISRSVAEKRLYRDLSRKIVDFAVLRGKTPISRFVAENCKYRDFHTTATNKCPWTHTGGLKDQHVKDELLRTQPDFIYVHLGVNDVNQKFDLRASLDNIFQFSLFVEESLKDTKLFFSMPLMTSDNDANERIGELRDAIWEYVTITNKNERKPFKERSVYYNPNANFMQDNQLIGEYLMDDGVHPSTRGKEVILGNFRHSIHEMTRLLLNKPKKTRLTGGLEPSPHSRT